MDENLLADKFNNTGDLSHILNVILQGKVGKGGNIQHMIIGLTIYNRYNDNKESRARLAFYKAIYNFIYNKDGTLNEKKSE